MKARAVAIVRKDDAVLLIHRRKGGAEYYTLPGGGVEEGETPEQACVRELAEETGLRAAVESPLHTLDNAGRSEHYFVMGPATGTPRLGGPESERDSGDNQYRLVWVPLADVASIGLKPDAITSHLVGIPNTVR
ncbi:MULTISPECIES: NUDIX domain-containing protein [unclassified Streptomyces]|uniref:NUDIX domain-containing protein n=1 Tax=Streptomyces sp. NBC_00060 TaxID=2975636 RepID=A0AAU2HC32_9ACTN